MTDAPVDTATELTPDDQAALLDLAEQSIRSCLDGGRPVSVTMTDLSPALRAPRGVFVTLHVAGALNGCIGTMEPFEPLAEAVSRLACEAAFNDPRLPPLRWSDYPQLSVEISVLSPLEPLPPMTEEELIGSLRPGVDGLLIEAGGRRGTFLPAVWAQVPDPHSFFAQLQRKAGIRPGFWPRDSRAWRYTTQEFGRHASG